MNGDVPGNCAGFRVIAEVGTVLILAALVVVYIILGMLYESYIHPLTILSTLPLGRVGALLMLIGCHFEPVR